MRRSGTILMSMLVLILASCSDDDPEPQKDGAATQTDQGTTTGDKGTTPTPETGVAADTGTASGSSYGGCDIDEAGKLYCVDYTGDMYKPTPALNAVKNACTSAGGTWNEAGCDTTSQGYCAWFEGTDNEQIYYFYNFEAANLATEKTNCEENTDRTWHDA